MKTHCENCGIPLHGGYCSRCGQSGKDFNVPVGEFARDLASETLSLDSRLKLTLQQLFLKPGSVPKQYVEGHRARFVPPIRLYVFASFAAFLLQPFSSDNVNLNGPEAPGAGEQTATDAVMIEAAASDTLVAGALIADSVPRASDGAVASFGRRPTGRFIDGGGSRRTGDHSSVPLHWGAPVLWRVTGPDIPQTRFRVGRIPVHGGPDAALDDCGIRADVLSEGGFPSPPPVFPDRSRNAA